MYENEVKAFVRRHFRHFNAAALVDAAEGYRAHIDKGGWMFLAMGGAMSTAELGVSLADMIRQGKIHAISCTGANLEEDLFNLVAHSHYRRVPHYRHLTPEGEAELLAQGLNRVTDTCIPEDQAFEPVRKIFVAELAAMGRAKERLFPHQILYRIIRSGKLEASHQIDPRDSWLLAACERDLPIFVPGWEDSTLGNFFAAECVAGNVASPTLVRGGVEYMVELVKWYTASRPAHPIGFFQIGGGISGDFPICVVPLIKQDLGRDEIPMWSYFCQISDSTTSYGSYSGAVPNEKITWGKLAVDTPSFIVESDATIVAPLIFAYVLAE